MVQSAFKKRNDASIKLQEIENWLLENSCLHPDYGEKVMQRNNLLIRV